jgi:hypothetical protein
MDETPTRPSLRRSQLEVMAGVAAAIVIALGLGFLLWRNLGVTARPAELSERLAFAAQWCVIPATCVLVCIAMVGNHRFFTRAIDPIAGENGAGASDRTLAIWKQVLTNTLEQAFLFAVIAPAFSVIAPQAWLKAIPILALLFVLGRVLFAVGYFIRPTLRAAGFALTCYPIVFLYGLTIWLYWFKR